VAEGKIVDVGEKVGLARKDIAALRRIDFEALEKDPAVAYKLTTKAAVFGEFTSASAESDKAAGVHPRVSWFKREILKSVISRPTDSKEARDAYHRGSKMLSEAFSRMKTVDDLQSWMKEWADRVAGSRRVYLSPAVSRLARTYLGGKGEYLTAEDLGMSASEYAEAKLKLRGGVGVGTTTDGRAYVIENDESQKTEYTEVTHAMGRRFAELIGIATKKRAWQKDGDFTMYPNYSYGTNAQRAAIKQVRVDVPTDDSWGWHSAEPAEKKPEGPALTQTKTGVQEFTWHRNLGAVERKGLPSRKEGTDGTALLKSFGLRGVEYGNWASDTERQWHTDMAFASLHDLADVLGITPDQLAVKGRLALAFGARGTGGKRPAAAHYEPVKRVINLTKLSGNGSLAHEWGHFLDNMIAHSYNPESGKPLWVSDGSSGKNVPPEITKAFRDVMNEIKEEPVTPERVSEIKMQRMKWSAELSALKTEASLLAYKKDPESREKYLQTINKHNDLVRKINALPRPSLRNTISSQFYEQAKANGKYWADDKELFARCFESFVESKMHEKGQRSSYLVDGTLDAGAPGVYLPHGDPHRTRINAAMEKLFAVLRSHDQFNKALTWLASLQKSTQPRLVVRA